MKPGDLVTFSSYGDKLQSLIRWSAYSRAHPWHPAVKAKRGPLIGLVIDKRPAKWGHEGDVYEIRWFESDGPRGRDGNHGMKGFYRRDLKFVSKGGK